MRSSVMTFFGSHSVSPVVMSFRPTAAAMSPARTSLISSRLLACICSMRPMRSLLALDRVVDGVAGLQHAGVDAEEGQRADEGVGRDLERQRRERLVVVDDGRSPRRSSPFSRMPLMARHVGRRRQVVDDRVEQRLHALVLERRAAQRRHDLVGQRARADARLRISSS